MDAADDKRLAAKREALARRKAQQQAARLAAQGQQNNLQPSNPPAVTAAPAAAAAAPQQTEDKPPLFEQEEISQIGDYQVIESIGRGAFGIVYRGISPTFETVAIKRVFLPNVPQSELESIEGEIQLLKNLSHPNIVQYRDAVRTSSHLNIVLEFVENGSLSSLFSKVKGLSEKFVAFYTTQVLSGLAYLHEQGVIHRDIKGANILSTKDGFVKLADFGVSKRLDESRKSDSVVGTPYWMAPEIIEMKGGQAPACDIWSVGCTVIELLTGKPPYYDLPQMTALFKIVQDDIPPLPDGISPNCEDFLRECFQKDPNLRISAERLLKHRWLKDAHQSLAEKQKKDDEKQKNDLKTNQNKSNDDIFGTDSDDEGDIFDMEPNSSHKAVHGNKTMRGNATLKKTALNLKKWAEKDDDDDDFDLEPLTTTKPKPLVTPNAPATIDFGDELDFDDDDDWAGSTKKPVVSSLNITTATKGPASNNKTSSSNKAPARKPLVVFDDDDILDFDDDEFDFGSTGPSVPTSVPNSGPLGSNSHTTGGTTKKGFQAGTLTMKDVKNIAIPTSSTGSFIPPSSFIAGTGLFQGNNQAFGLEAMGDGAEDEEDIFAQEDDEDTTLDENTQLMQKFDIYVKALDTKRSDTIDSNTIIDACNKMNTFITQNSEVKAVLSVLPRIVLPLIELLPRVDEPCLFALTSLAILLSAQPVIRQHSVFVLLIPALLPYVTSSYTQRVRMAVCTVIGTLCSTSDFTRQIFLASGGLPILVDLLCSDHYYLSISEWPQQSSEFYILLSAIDNIHALLTSGKNDIMRACVNCDAPIQIATTLFRLACTCVGIQDDLTTTAHPDGYLQDPKMLSKTELNAIVDIGQLPRARDPTLLGPITKLVNILELLANGDTKVKESLYHIHTFRLLVSLLPVFQQDRVTPILKILRMLSLDPNSHRAFEATPAIPILVAFLYSPLFEHQLHSLQCLYHLCNTNVQRQIRAAQAGIIPILIQNVRNKNSLNHFACPMLCWLTKPAVTRLEVRKNGGFELLLDTLSNPFFCDQALAAIINMVDDGPTVIVRDSTPAGNKDLSGSSSGGGDVSSTFCYVNGAERYLSVLAHPSNCFKLLAALHSAQSVVQYSNIVTNINRLLKLSPDLTLTIMPLVLPDLATKLASPVSSPSYNTLRLSLMGLMTHSLEVLSTYLATSQHKDKYPDNFTVNGPTVAANIIHHTIAILKEGIYAKIQDLSLSVKQQLVQIRAKTFLQQIDTVVASYHRWNATLQSGI